MRLSETRFIIESNLPALDAVKCSDDPGNSSLSIMINIPDAIFAIDNLKDIQCLTPSITRLTSNEIYSMPMKNFKISKSIANDFMNSLAKIKEQCGLIVKLANDTVPRMTPNTICIKLPADCSFGTISKTAKAFDELFNLVNTNEQIDGTVKLQGVESGSAWLYALATTAATAIFVEKIVSCIYDIVKKHIETQKSIETLKQLKYITDVKKDGKEIMHELSKKYIEKLNNDKTFEENPEMQARWINNIASIAKLVEEGMKILPSLEAPKEKQVDSAKKIAKVTSAIEDIKKLEAAVSDIPEESPTDNISDDTPTNGNPAEE